MNKVFASAYHIDQTTTKSFVHSVIAKQLDISEKDIVFALHNIDNYVQNVEKLCSVKRYYKGAPKLINFNRVLADKFIERGGFETYFKSLSLNKNELTLQPSHKPSSTNKYKKAITAILIGLLVTITGGLILLLFTKLFGIY